MVPFARLRGDPAIEVDAGSTPAVVFFEPGVASPIDADSLSRARQVGTAAAFDRRARGRALSFAKRRGAFVDGETGSTWDLSGTAVRGRLRGTRLRPLRHDEPFWFVLAAFEPEARIAGG